MSKFKIGDKVFLSPSSRWVDDGSSDAYSVNPLKIEGVIDEVDGYEYGIMWSNGRHNSCYVDEDLLPSVVSQPTQECPYCIIEELECKIESLEELISEQAARIRELEAPQDDGVFKPVSEYTLKDWQQAALFEWKFKCRGGHTVTIDQIDLDEGCRPVLCSAGWCHSINGMWDETTGEDADDIIERIK